MMGNQVMMRGNHTARLGDHLTPVGSAIMPTTREASWVCLVPLPLLSIKRAVWHTLTGTMLGMKSGFLLSEVATGNKLEKHSAYKRILFLLLIHSHFLPFEERMSQVASTGGRGSGELFVWDAQSRNLCTR
jgi:hypothetical protein